MPVAQRAIDRSLSDRLLDTIGQGLNTHGYAIVRAVVPAVDPLELPGNLGSLVPPAAPRAVRCRD